MKRIYLTFAAISLVAGLASAYIAEDYTYTPRGIGILLGKGIGFFCISGIIPILLHFFSRCEESQKQFRVTTVWGVTSVILGVLVYSGLQVEKELVQEIKSEYSVDGCEYVVTFPGKPEVTNANTTVWDNFEIASYYGNSLLRAECHLDETFTKFYFTQKINLFALLEKQAKRDGLSDTIYKYEDSNLGRHAWVRGYKKVNVTPVTYEIHLYAGNSSLLSVYVGGISKTYPTQEVSAYLRSIKKII